MRAFGYGSSARGLGRTVAALALTALLTVSCKPHAGAGGKDALLLDDSSGDNWAGYGRTFGEQHFSPLTDISASNVSGLGLAWSIDIEHSNPATVPVAVDGILYYTTGLSVIHAVEVATGKTLWVYDPEVGPHTPEYRLRSGWGSRGLAYWDGKVYVGTMNGRLIAIDARSGKPIWTVNTTEGNDKLFISGAPRVFEGKVIIGHGGADSSSSRNYVTTYDAQTGKQLWRFFITPGDPAKGFEDKTQEMASKTWKGPYWKDGGGGGSAWNAFAYDVETGTVFVGTGNGAPWNQKIRSPGGGDNLFVASIVALDAKTGAYKWHYQVNPGETWDYNATMDMELADLTIDGKPRKVLMQAPKNGFFYVIDRTNGKLISAEKLGKVTWAKRIDLKTGRPEEDPGARFPNGQQFELWPSMFGAHNWMPMSYSPQTKLVYVPRINMGGIVDDRGVDIAHWKRPAYGEYNAVNVDFFGVKDPNQFTSDLVAWDPIKQKPAWTVRTFGTINGGTLATAGNLVFQGQVNGKFVAYAADTGKAVWSFDAHAPIIAAPITYRAKGVQYVTVLVGVATNAGLVKQWIGGLTPDYYTQGKRVLTFKIGGNAVLPPNPKDVRPAPDDPTYKPDPALAARGNVVYNQNCFDCHGIQAESAGTAPDLRKSLVPQSEEAFTAVVRQGGLLQNGMPRFDLSDDEFKALRQFLRSMSADLRAARKEKPAAHLSPSR